MATAVAELVEYEQNQSAKADAKFAALIDRLEAGEDVGERQSLATLREAGKTTEDVACELARRRRVAKLREVISAAADTRVERAKLTDRQAEAKRELKVTTERLNDELKSIMSQLLALNGRDVDADNARRELRQLCPPPADEAELQAALRQCIADIRHIESLIGGHPDADAKLAEAAQHAERADALAQKIETIPYLDLFRRADVKRAHREAVYARDAATNQANISSRFRHQWSRLKALRARHAELLEKQQQQRTADD